MCQSGNQKRGILYKLQYNKEKANQSCQISLFSNSTYTVVWNHYEDRTPVFSVSVYSEHPEHLASKGTQRTDTKRPITQKQRFA